MNLTKFALVSMLMVPAVLAAQSVETVTSTKEDVWKEGKTKLSSRPSGPVVLDISKTADNYPLFRDWGMTFNELDHVALSKVDGDGRKEFLNNLFSPDGEMRFTRGRISPGANDYAESWYSCDEVQGDLDLKYFNIDRDRQRIIPFIKEAQAIQPNLTFWISPWSPPSWMKINGDYPVVSSKHNRLETERADTCGFQRRLLHLYP